MSQKAINFVKSPLCISWTLPISEFRPLLLIKWPKEIGVAGRNIPKINNFSFSLSQGKWCYTCSHSQKSLSQSSFKVVGFSRKDCCMEKFKRRKTRNYGMKKGWPVCICLCQSIFCLRKIAVNSYSRVHILIQS